jgi:apolipoprotein D and lipocalin family protein
MKENDRVSDNFMRCVNGPQGSLFPLHSQSLKELFRAIRHSVLFVMLFRMAQSVHVVLNHPSTNIKGSNSKMKMILNSHLFKERKMSLLALALVLLSVSVWFLSRANEPLETVKSVDMNKYSGRWYEIASYPQRFQKGCHCTTATYTPRDKGYVVVENRCNKDSINGPESYIKGKAFVDKNSGNAKLKVQFFWPFRGKYWIIDLADDYSYAVVGHPNRKYLWILSRTPQPDKHILSGILDRMEKKGFDRSKLSYTLHR